MENDFNKENLEIAASRREVPERATEEGGPTLDNEAVLRYASEVIVLQPFFLDFMAAMMSFFGPGPYPLAMLRMVYTMLRHSNPDLSNRFSPPGTEEIKTTPDEEVMEHFERLRQLQEKQRINDEMFWEIDNLMQLLRDYRHSDKFQQMRNFAGRFKQISAFNAMMVSLQRPGARYVRDEYDWCDLMDCVPKPNAQPLCYLNFSPIGWLFDIDEVEPRDPDRVNPEYQKIIVWLNTAHEAKPISQPVLEAFYKNVKDNLPVFGIKLLTDFRASKTVGGYLDRVPHGGESCIVTVTKGQQGRKDYDEFHYPAPFVMGLREGQNTAERFRMMCQLLAHLFCGHTWYSFPWDAWFTRRPRRFIPGSDVKPPVEKRSKKDWPDISDFELRPGLTEQSRVFEATTVAWIVCQRHGIVNNIHEYLSDFITNDEVPPCDVARMFKAVDYIELMMGFKKTVDLDRAANMGGKDTMSYMAESYDFATSRDSDMVVGAFKIHVKNALWYKHDKVFARAADEHFGWN